MWTWCRRYNPTSFGLQKTVEDHYYYSEQYEISANLTAFDYCSKISFAFNEQGIRCVDGSYERATICESTSNVTNADLVRIYFLNFDAI